MHIKHWISISPLCLGNLCLSVCDMWSVREHGYVPQSWAGECYSWLITCSWQTLEAYDELHPWLPCTGGKQPCSSLSCAAGAADGGGYCDRRHNTWHASTVGEGWDESVVPIKWSTKCICRLAYLLSKSPFLCLAQTLCFLPPSRRFSRYQSHLLGLQNCPLKIISQDIKHRLNSKTCRCSTSGANICQSTGEVHEVRGIFLSIDI